MAASGVRTHGRWLARRSLLAANIVAAAVMLWGFAGEYSRHRRMESEVARLEAEAERLQSGNLKTAEIGRQFAADEAMEREARLKLGSRRPGESVIIVKERQADSAVPADGAASGSAADAPGVAANLRLWWRYFFGQEG